MHPSKSWANKIKDLQQPFQTWLSQSSLVQINDISAVLFVDQSTFVLLKDMSLLSKIYPLVKSMYPSVTSLYISSSSLQKFVKDKVVEIYSIEVIS